MKTKSIATIAAIAFLPVAGFTQAPPSPPNPPGPPAPPKPPDRHEKMPKVPVTFLGVETSPVPPVVSEQLGLAKGFGLVVDYVVPDGPAAAAGVQQNDILKMLNDQILIEPSQLRKLLQSFSEGTNVTLTILRKGQEQKITVKLTKKEVPNRHAFGPGRDGHWDFNFDQDFGNIDLGDLKEGLRDLKQNLREELGERRGMIRDAVMKAHEEVGRAHEEARRARDQIKITTTRDSGLNTTKIDIGKAQIVFSDDKGELRIETLDGKKILTAKDPQGLLLFGGPVETKEDLDKVPAEVRERYEKLQQRDLPWAGSSGAADNEDDDNSADMDEGDQDEVPSVQQVSAQSFPHSIWMIHTVLI
jgi:serine protease Do